MTAKKKDANYWIIEADHDQCHGPYTLGEAEDEVQEFANQGELEEDNASEWVIAQVTHTIEIEAEPTITLRKVSQ